MTAIEILVIILSAFLAIFLVVGIVLLSLLIKVTMQIKKVTGVAEKTASNVESLTGKIAKASSKLFVARLVSNQLMKIVKKK